jgi:hypothetical protein
MEILICGYCRFEDMMEEDIVKINKELLPILLIQNYGTEINNIIREFFDRNNIISVIQFNNINEESQTTMKRNRVGAFITGMILGAQNKGVKLS